MTVFLLIIIAGLIFFLAVVSVRKKNIYQMARQHHEKERILQARIAVLEKEITQISVILGHMAEGVIGVNADQQILVINPAAEKILQLQPGAAVGKNLLEAARDVHLSDIIGQAIRTQSYFAGEAELTYPEEKILHAGAIGLPPSAGQMRGVLVFYDVTPIRKLEKMRREFVANVSHELRTPMTSIRGFLETLLGGALKDANTSESFLKMMQEDTNRLTRLVDDLLELSKIESKESPLKRAPLDLRFEVEKAAAIIQPKMEQKKIRLENAIPSENFPKISADRDRLKQVFLNLLENAVKFNRDGGSIKIFAEKEQGRVRVSISDTGIGIPEEAVPHVFERFFRVDKSRTAGTGGSGLGLSIVKHIVESHGGQVSCQSRSGQGTTFSFTLPSA